MNFPKFSEILAKYQIPFFLLFLRRRIFKKKRFIQIIILVFNWLISLTNERRVKINRKLIFSKEKNNNF